MEQPGASRPNRLQRIRAMGLGTASREAEGPRAPAPRLNPDLMAWLEDRAPSSFPSVEELRDPLTLAKRIGRRELVDELWAVYNGQGGQ